MKLFAKFGAIFVTSQSVVLRLCKIKRLNRNFFSSPTSISADFISPLVPLIPAAYIVLCSIIGIYGFCAALQNPELLPFVQPLLGPHPLYKSQKNQLSYKNNNDKKGGVFLLHFGPKIPLVLQKSWK